MSRRQYIVEVRGEGLWDDYHPDYGLRVGHVWKPAPEPEHGPYTHIEDAENSLKSLIKTGFNEADVRVVVAKKPKVRRSR